MEHSLSYEDEDEREDFDAQEVFGECSQRVCACWCCVLG